MTTVDQLAKVLEDISIKDDYLSDEEPSFVLSGEKHEPELVNSYDQKFAQLLELVDRYEKLANGKFRLNFINGSLNLSRSNYNNRLSLGKKYGPDSYDLRPYDSCKTVDIVANGGKFQLVDQRAKQVERENIEKNNKKTVNNIQPERKDDSSIKDQHKGGPAEAANINGDGGGGGVVVTGISSESSSAGAGTLKNRKDQAKKLNSEIQAQSLESKSSSAEERKLVDPLLQFGGLVPYQLRQSQKYFEEWLSDSIQVLNLQTEISKLIKEIERESTGAKETTDKGSESRSI
ncbi:hypothetical protein CLIB1423_41S00452 [[Candida] railenensis]|uniref:Vacuolar ATPase assembly protein VMA22 n=1 Tax=[Candida] railenensis TaxID=45579 RepID=A0A9P0W1V0_9ASCO|nr:hypothetical protein CLIB1423_41S00452 [[Candida] railenensis]